MKDARKKRLKLWLVDHLAGFLKAHLNPEDRAALVAQVIQPSAFLEHRSDVDVIAHLSACLRRLHLNSIAAEGDCGTFVGHLDDEIVIGRYLAERTWSPLLRRLTTSVLANGGSYIDVGANIGLTIVPVARNPKVSCYALEPEPLNFAYLRANLALNGVMERVTALPIAAFSRKDTLIMELSKHNFGDHRIRRSNQSNSEVAGDGRERVSVEAMPLDAVLDLDRLQSPIVCKVDTQGAEVEVLKGAPHLLQRCDLLIVEVEPSCLSRLGHSVSDLMKIVKELNFTGGYFTSFDRSSLASEPSYLPMSTLLDSVDRTVGNARPNDYWDLILMRDPVFALSSIDEQQ